MEIENALNIIINEIRQMAREGSAPKELVEKELSAKTKFNELNLDSLGELSLLSAIENRAEIILGEVNLYELKTLNDLARIVSES